MYTVQFSEIIVCRIQCLSRIPAFAVSSELSRFSKKKKKEKKKKGCFFERNVDF
jgi:hypothetical protein